jgi:hypothetical protein
MPYHLEGRMLEACSCDAICPCWIGQDPDGGKCLGTIAWHFDKGHVDGIDVSGLTIAVAADIPGNALQGNWKVVVFVDDKASKQQEEALLNVYTGKKGGPVADLVKLVGTVVGVERTPIEFSIVRGQGHIKIGSTVTAEVESLKSTTGAPTVLSDAVFSVIPGSPAFVGKSKNYKFNSPALGVTMDLSGHSSVQGAFIFDA